jgi:hypothetical protein
MSVLPAAIVTHPRDDAKAAAVVLGIVAALLVVTLLPGCTIFGLGIGSAIPRSETVDLESIPRGAEVELKLDSMTSAVDGTLVSVSCYRAGPMMPEDGGSIRLFDGRRPG